MSRITRALLTLALLALAAPASAAAAPALVPVGSFDSPVYVSAPPRDFSRLFVVEVGGRVRRGVGRRRRDPDRGQGRERDRPRLRLHAVPRWRGEA